MPDHLTSDPWPPSRIGDNFEQVREDIHELKQDIRVFAPLVGDVSGLLARADALARDVGKVETAVAQYVGRSVTKQLVIVSTPLFLTALGVILALLTGKIG